MQGYASGYRSSWGVVCLGGHGVHMGMAKFSTRHVQTRIELQLIISIYHLFLHQGEEVCELLVQG